MIINCEQRWQWLEGSCRDGSFRHSYATWRLQAGRSPIEIARNMGTSLAMIERHYYHYMPRLVADRLTAGKAVGEDRSVEAGDRD